MTRNFTRGPLAVVATALALIVAHDAFAQPTEPPPAAAPLSRDEPSLAPNAEAPKAPAAPYSLPFQLRPAGPPPDVMRLDTVIAPYGSGTASGTATVSMLTGGLRFGSHFGAFARAGIVNHSTDATPTTQIFTNPVVGGVYGTKLGSDLRLALYFAAALPVGSGGGNTPNKDAQKALGAGNLARSAMDGTMFAVNDLALIPGADLAYTAHGFTVQVEATVGQLLRTRGEAVQKDATRTNFMSGVHVGYFVLPFLSVGVEGRYQRWLTTPAAVEKDASLRDNLTAAGGLRAIIPVRGATKMLPGVSYAMGLRGATGDRDYHVVQVDIPVVF